MKRLEVTVNRNYIVKVDDLCLYEYGNENFIKSYNKYDYGYLATFPCDLVRFDSVGVVIPTYKGSPNNMLFLNDDNIFYVWNLFELSSCKIYKQGVELEECNLFERMSMFNEICKYVFTANRLSFGHG